jgi:PPM family protein phosphatase
VTQPIVTGLSDIGRIRSRNEDSIALLPDLGVAVVADGMGGHPGGDVASRIAAQTTALELQDSVGPAIHRDQDVVSQVRTAMAESVGAAHEAIRAEGKTDPELEGMGTTVTALVVDLPTATYVIGHVGDSRAYLLRNDALTQITRDDTWVQDRVDNGEFSQEQADRHPFGHILTQCVGLEDTPTIHVMDGRTEAGDVYLLCSDGLVGVLNDDVIADLLRSAFASGPSDEAARSAATALVASANEAGGYDNITVALTALG